MAQTLTPQDSDSDQRYAPVHDNMAGFEESFHGADATTSGSEIRDLKNQEEQARFDREFADIAENYNENGTNPKDDTASVGDGLADSEDKAADDTVGNGYTGDKTAGKDADAAPTQKGAKGLIKELAKKKGLIAATAGAGAGGVGLLLLLILLGSSLQIPNLAQNITNYEMARMSRQFAKSVMQTTDETAAIQASNDTAWSRFKARFSDAPGVTRVKDTWSKLDKYRPAKVMANMQANKDLVFNYGGKSDIVGRPVLTSVTLNGQEINVVQPTGLKGAIPGLKSILKFKNDIDFSAKFQPALNSGLRDTDVGPVIRGAVAKELRKKLGISLFAWILGRFKGKNAEGAQVEETQERAKAVDAATKETPNNATTEKLKDGVDAAQQAEEAATDSVPETKAAIADGGIVKSPQKIIADAVKTSGLDTILGIANPIYAVSMSVCIVYDGSLEQSGPTVDQQVAQEQATYYHIGSAADQLKYGTKDATADTATELANAGSGTVASLNSTTNSNAILRAYGQNVDTSTTLSAQQSAGGQYTLLDATLGSLGVPGAATVAKSIDAIANGICPYATNTTVAIGGAVVNIGVALATLGGSEAAAEVAGEASEQVISRTGASLAENLVTKYIGRSAGRITGILYDTGKGTVKGGIKVAAATILAKLIVDGRSGQTFSGYAMGTDLANAADAGGNIVANELERAQLFGRPMLMNEVCSSNLDDRNYLASNFSRQSTYDRYLNVHEANSLVSRTAIMVSSNMNGSIGRSLVNFGQSILQPLHSFGMLANMFTGVSHAAANCNADASEYGNVQFGWSSAEEGLIASNDSYRPLENQEILDASGKEDDIAKKYAVCFGYDYNPDSTGPMDPTAANGKLQLSTGIGESASLGTLLSGGYIIRDTHGNVINYGSPEDPPKGLCSPQNLSYNSTDSLAADNQSTPAPRDLIFRWRLAMRQTTTLNQLVDLQNVTNT